jgi:thymidylate synthase (FAD)
MADNIQSKNGIRDPHRSSITRRVTVPALEKLLYEELAILDHGFIRVIDYMGDDSAVVQAARVSYGTGTKRRSEDRGLIFYLMRHGHTTPFEMAEIKLHVRLPIFVARQWIRHRTASVNEYSARYSIVDKEFYIPGEEHLAGQSGTNKQGREAPLSREEAMTIMRLLREDAARNYEHYIWMLNEGEHGAADPKRFGLARELARMNLTLTTYTQWYWKIDLHNLLKFLKLRSDSHAQYEIRAYAVKILEIVRQWVPITYEAFVEYGLESVTLSKRAMLAISRMVSGENVSREQVGLSSREWDELMKILKTTGELKL